MKPPSSSNPLETLERLSAAEASRRAEIRAENRRRFPELAAVTDSLPEGSWRMRCVMDHDGNVLMGKPPEPEPSLRAQFIAQWIAKGLVPKDYA